MSAVVVVGMRSSSSSSTASLRSDVNAASASMTEVHSPTTSVAPMLVFSAMVVVFSLVVGGASTKGAPVHCHTVLIGYESVAS